MPLSHASAAASDKHVFTFKGSGNRFCFSILIYLVDTVVSKCSVIMTGNTEEQTAETVSRWSKFRTIIPAIVLGFGLVCLFAGVVLLALVFALSKPSNCSSSKSDHCSHSSNSEVTAGEICGGVSVLLFLVGGSILIACHKRMKKRSSIQVVISEIPAQDLEKSPAATLPRDHIPHREPFVIASSIDLPDYFTTVKNSKDVYPYVNAGFWTADIDVPDDENPPPCYEQAIKMSGLAAYADHARTHLEQGNGEDTRL